MIIHSTTNSLLCKPFFKSIVYFFYRCVYYVTISYCKELSMPKGKGTYGSKVGRPLKKKMAGASKKSAMKKSSLKRK